MDRPLPQFRSLHGATAALWAGEGVRVEASRWVALSGARGVDFNVVLCHGASGGGAIPQVLAEIASMGEPAIIMVAGPALAEVQQLVEASWVCVGAVPFMQLDLSGLRRADPAPHVRRLSREEMPDAQRLVDEVFGIGPDLARVALPDTAPDVPGRSVWGAFSPDGPLWSCVGTVLNEDVVAVWSMATARAHQRQGHAARLLLDALASAQDEGARHCLLNASIAGEPFYRALGFQELERWQLWSRPRWVIGRV